MTRVTFLYKPFENIHLKVFCGTDPLPELFRAKKYKIHKKFLLKADFQFIMRNLPVNVCDDDIEDMFSAADVDQDGKLSFKVFHGVFQSFN